MKKLKILVTGGIHGDEPTGIQVARHFLKKGGPIKGILCNPKAILAQKRFLETDLNRSFGVEAPVSLEEGLARSLQKIVAKYDLIIDIHNTKAENTLCAITTSRPNNLQIYLARHFGFRKIVIMPPSGSLIALLPKKSISLEISTDYQSTFSAKKLIEKITTIKAGRFKEEMVGIVTFYEFVNKVHATTLKRLKLEKSHFANFKKLTKGQKKKLGLEYKNSYYPIFLKRKNEEIAFSLVKRINVQ